MQFALTERQEADRAAFAAFVGEHVAPHAGRWDREQALPDGVVRALAGAGYLVPTLPAAAGGRDMDPLTYGLLTEEVGRGCASVRNLLAVQGMVAHAVARWGTAEQRARWVPRIAAGETLAAFALTEPDVGSDARNGSTAAVRDGAGYVLDGRKKWISFGQRADLFLVFARLEGDLAAFLVERGAPGLATRPQTDLLGLRASGLAEVTLDACRVPGECLVSRGPLTFDAVATTALDHGRYSTAWGCVGLTQACLSASLAYAAERAQFGVPIAEHQLVQRLLTDMVAAVAAARLLCLQAGALRARSAPDSVRSTLLAKYFASAAAFRAASDAVQLHGANGCGPDYPVQRHLRDAKIQEIIEGTTQVQQVQIAEMALRARPAAR